MAYGHDHTCTGFISASPPPNQEFAFPSFNMVLYPSTLLTLGICPAGVVATALHQNPKLNTAIMQLYELVQSGDIQVYTILINDQGIQICYI